MELKHKIPGLQPVLRRSINYPPKRLGNDVNCYQVRLVSYGIYGRVAKASPKVKDVATVTEQRLQSIKSIKRLIESRRWIGIIIKCIVETLIGPDQRDAPCKNNYSFSVKER